MKTVIKQYDDGRDHYVGLGIDHELTNPTLFWGAIGRCRRADDQSTDDAKRAALKDALESLAEAAAEVRRLLGEE